MNKYNNLVETRPSFKIIWLTLGWLLLMSGASTLHAQSGLIAYYPFNDNATDFSGNGNHGNRIGGVSTTADRFGNPCSALLFDGYSGYVEVPTSRSLESPSSSITISTWYKLNRVNANNLWLTVVCKGRGNVEQDYNPHYRLQVQQNTNVQISTCSQVSPAMSSTISLATKFTICDNNLSAHLFEQDAWHFYAITYDGYVVKAFMDGQKVFEYPYSNLLTGTGDPLFIGMDEPGSTEYFNGALDELRIFSNALSESEIRALYNDQTANAYAADFSVDMPSNIDVPTDPGGCTALVQFTPPGFSANPCTQVNVQQVEGPNAGSVFPVGTTRVTYQYSTGSDYSQYVSFYVHVKDPIPPVIQMPKNELFTIKEGDVGKKFTFNTPKATDNCKLKTVYQTGGKKSGDVFEPGKHKISFTAEDESGNTTSGDFWVEVTVIKDPVKPVVDTPVTKVVIVRDTIRVVDTVKVKVVDTVKVKLVDTTKIRITDTVKVKLVDTTKVKITDTVKVKIQDTVKVKIQDTVKVKIKDTVKIVDTVRFVHRPVPDSLKQYMDTLTAEFKPNNLLFLFDVSTSMNTNGTYVNINFAKTSVTSLIKKLRSRDKLIFMTYSDDTKEIFPHGYLFDRPKLVSKINALTCNGGTEGAAAIVRSLELLKTKYDPNANNEVFLFTDGEIDNIDNKTKRLIKACAEDKLKPIRLNIFFLGNAQNYRDDMKELTDLGKGRFEVIETMDAAQDVLIDLIKNNTRQ